MDSMDLSGFGKVLTKNVPHIHEKILLSLDYETFKKCRGVCKTWDDVLNTESLQKKASCSSYKDEMEKELTKRIRTRQIEMEILCYEKPICRIKEMSSNYSLITEQIQETYRVTHQVG